MKKITTIVITTLTSAVLLSTSIGITPIKAEESVKNNVYIAGEKTVISEVSKENIPNAPVAEKTPISKVETDRPSKVEADRLDKLNSDSITNEETDRLAKIEADRLVQVEADKLAKIEADRLAKIETNRLSKIEADRLAKIKTDRLAKIEADRIATVLVQNKTVTGTKFSTFLSSAANLNSVLKRAVVLHGGDPSNTCVYFSSEAMRRIGVAVPLATCNTMQYLSYLRGHAWVTTYDIKKLTPGSICFTTSNWSGHPTHTFAFMGWVNSGSYTLAYVADNQGSTVHIRNMGATYATDAFAFYMHTPTKPQKITAASSGYNSIKISWSGVTGATSYGIYRATSSTGTYKLISTTTKTSYNNTGLTSNCTYFYKVRTYRIIGTAKQYSDLSSVVSSKPILATPISVKAVSSSYNSINISWSGVAGATLYEIYRATSIEEPYTLISTTTATRYSNTGLITNSTYYYKVRSYKVIGKVKVYSDLSDTISSKPIPAAPTNLKATKISSKNIKLTWNPVISANGYEICTTISSSVTYSLLTDTTYLFYTNSDLITGRIYYYKVRPYQIIEAKKICGDWSSEIYVKP